MSGSHRAFAVGFAGGSGIAYGLRLVRALLEAGHSVHVCATNAAYRVLRAEEGIDIESTPRALLAFLADQAGGQDRLGDRLQVYAGEAVESTPASGSAGIEATVVCPCSMGTLARIAHGFSSNLLERSADVALKEGRRLLLVPRETPLSKLHLQNMLKAAELGALILPAMPGFYHRPQTVDDIVDFLVGKVLDQLGVDSDVIKRWQTPEASAGEPSSMWNEGED